LDRDRAVQRGLHVIYGIATDPRYFEEWGHDLLWCLYCIWSSAKDPAIRQTVWRMGNERALAWRRLHPVLPRNADVDTIVTYATGSYTSDGFGVRDEGMKEQIRRAAARWSVLDFLNFDPSREPPPSDVPDQCARCGRYNSRGTRFCRKCGARLEMQSRYDIWLDALLTTYTGDVYGVKMGAHYPDVIRWISVMRPYGRSIRDPEFYNIAYAITHVVYTLDHYSVYRLSPESLPEEFEFLKATMPEILAQRDFETLGEYLDSLRAFGMTTADPLIQTGMAYVLSTQNQDGSWGNMREGDIYKRYHPTWTGVDGLRQYRWGETLKPQLGTDERR